MRDLGESSGELALEIGRVLDRLVAIAAVRAHRRPGLATATTMVGSSFCFSISAAW